MNPMFKKTSKWTALVAMLALTISCGPNIFDDLPPEDFEPLNACGEHSDPNADEDLLLPHTKDTNPWVPRKLKTDQFAKAAGSSGRALAVQTG